MKMRKFVHEGVHKDGSVKSGGAVETKGLIRTGDVKSFVDRKFLSIILPLDEKKGIVEGIYIELSPEDIGKIIMGKDVVGE